MIIPTCQSAWAWTTLGALVAALARALHPVPLVKQHVSGLPKGEKKGNLEIIRWWMNTWSHVFWMFTTFNNTSQKTQQKVDAVGSLGICQVTGDFVGAASIEPQMISASAGATMTTVEFRTRRRFLLQCVHGRNIFLCLAQSWLWFLISPVAFYIHVWNKVIDEFLGCSNPKWLENEILRYPYFPYLSLVGHRSQKASADIFVQGDTPLKYLKNWYGCVCLKTGETYIEPMDLRNCNQTWTVGCWVPLIHIA